jgi:hypothetical protein
MLFGAMQFAACGLSSRQHFTRRFVAVTSSGRSLRAQGSPEALEVQQVPEPELAVSAALASRAGKALGPAPGPNQGLTLLWGTVPIEAFRHRQTSLVVHLVLRHGPLFRWQHHRNPVTHSVSHCLGDLNHLADQDRPRLAHEPFSWCALLGWRHLLLPIIGARGEPLAGEYECIAQNGTTRTTAQPRIDLVYLGGPINIPIVITGMRRQHIM